MQSELTILNQRLAAVCCERTEVQRRLFEFRNTRSDLTEWQIRLEELNGEKDALICRQRQVFKSLERPIKK